MKKGTLSNVFLILVLLIGLSLLLYPTIANWWNSSRQSKVVQNYVEQISTLDNNRYAQLLEEAYDYNDSLTRRGNSFLLSEEQLETYGQLLNIGGDGIMGYVEIPSIDVELPIYHGTEDRVLASAIGHLDWTSLPVGGESTHCVVSGHRGLPSARLFTDLDQLSEGDYFMLNVLDEVLTYEVDQIRIVEPQETDELLIQEGKDLVTLVTCTPYGVNSHRMLVRGHRVDNLEQAQTVRVTADAVIVEKIVVVPFILGPMLLIILLVVLLMPTKKKKK